MSFWEIAIMTSFVFGAICAMYYCCSPRADYIERARSLEESRSHSRYCQNVTCPSNRSVFVISTSFIENERSGTASEASKKYDDLPPTYEEVLRSSQLQSTASIATTTTAN